MFLSVIVPVFNGEKTIEKCLLSIIGQDYLDLEIIVVNDGSTDDTENIVNKLIEQNKDRIIKIVNKKNAGLPQARKTGVEVSEGEYIGFVDADDWIEPDMYSVMIENIRGNVIDMVCSDIIYDYPSSVENHIQKYASKTPISGRKALYYMNNRKAVYPNCVNKIIRKSLFENVTFPEGNLVGEDYTITRQLLLNSSKVIILNYLGYHYIQYRGSMARSGFDDSQKNGFYNFKRILKETYKSGDRELIHSSNNYIINEFLWIIISMAVNKKYDTNMIKWVKKYIRKRFITVINDNNNSLLFKASCFMAIFNCKILGHSFLFYDKVKNDIK